MAINGSSSSQSVANPKSDNLAVRELSSIILLGFMFPWTILNLFSSCKYFKPLAIPRQIPNLAFQSSFVVEFGSTNQGYWYLQVHYPCTNRRFKYTITWVSQGNALGERAGWKSGDGSITEQRMVKGAFMHIVIY